MLDLVEKRSFSQHAPKRTIKISCCGIHGHRHMWSQTLLRESSASSRVHICDAEENHSVPRREVDTMDLTCKVQYLLLEVTVLI